MYIPDQWLNINAIINEVYEPFIDPSTGKPVDARSLEDLFPKSLVEQEFNLTEKYIPIPEDVLRKYRNWRPTPLVRARALEERLKTNCKIFYKYEGISPIGSHKANSGVAQAYYAKKEGKSKLYAETGAGQWGSAVSMAAAFYGLESQVFMVGNSFDSKPSRRILMETFGGSVSRSPTTMTDVGRSELRSNPGSSGSLGLAISEAMEATRADPHSSYAIGSAFGFVCLHQTIIGQELKAQLAAHDIRVDALISCVGGGSSFAGLVFPFVDEVSAGKKIDLIAVESTSTPKMTKGKFSYDYGDSAKKTPLIKMYTIGSGFASPPSHSGGLRYHGLSSQVSKLINMGIGTAESYSQMEIFNAAKLFAQCEGLIPAPESAHSIASAINYAKTYKNERRNIVFCLTGHGFFDLAGYEKFNNGEMNDSDPSASEIAKSLASLTNTDTSGIKSSYTKWKSDHFGNERNSDLAIKGSDNKAVFKELDLKLISEKALFNLPESAVIRIDDGAVFTPGAHQLLKQKRIVVQFKSNAS